MRSWMCLACVLGLALSAAAQPLRVAVLEFTNETGLPSDSRLGGAINMDRLAAKGLYPLAQSLLGKGDFVLIDRREFLAEIERLNSPGVKPPTDAKPSFLRAAQAVRADVVLRGKLLNFSTEKRVVSQGGYRTELSTLTLRVGLDCLDATDGTVVSVSEGSASKEYRLTDADQTLLGEETALNMLQQAVDSAAAAAETALNKYMAANLARPKVKLTVQTTADPALVELDGILVGTTPLEGFETYKGDHVLTVGKPGYRDVSKQILFEQDTKITVPMLRTELTAEEIKDILDKARIHAYIGMEPALIIENIEEKSE